VSFELLVVEKVVVVKESEDYDVLEAIAGDSGIVI
jgi:hypothetical protein